VTLIVCNLLVIVTFTYSMFLKEDGDSEMTESDETKDKPDEDDGQYTSLGAIPTPTETSVLTLTDISGTQFSSNNTNTSGAITSSNGLTSQSSDPNTFSDPESVTGTTESRAFSNGR
jgi:hypothetical protein